MPKDAKGILDIETNSAREIAKIRARGLHHIREFFDCKSECRPGTFCLNSGVYLKGTFEPVNLKNLSIQILPCAVKRSQRQPSKRKIYTGPKITRCFFANFASLVCHARFITVPPKLVRPLNQKSVIFSGLSHYVLNQGILTYVVEKNNLHVYISKNVHFPHLGLYK